MNEPWQHRMRLPGPSRIARRKSQERTCQGKSRFQVPRRSHGRGIGNTGLQLLAVLHYNAALVAFRHPSFLQDESSEVQSLCHPTTLYIVR